MNLTVLQENLAAGLAAVARGVSTGQSLPILQNVLLDASGDRLRLTTNNLEVGIHCWLDARVQSPGQATVPAKLLTELVKTLAPGPIDLETGKGRLVLRSDRHKTTLNTIAVEEFPIPPTGLDGNRIALEADAFRALVERTVYAANPNDVGRPALTGVLFEWNETGLTLAAADGFRLAVAHHPVEGNEQELPPLVVPARNLALAASLLAAGEPIVVHLPVGTPSQLLFAQESLVLVSQLLDARFPDYRQIVPHEWATRAVVAAGDLVRAIKTCLLFARSDGNHPVSLALEPGTGIAPGSVTVSAGQASVGDTTTILEADVEGEPCELSLNARFLLDVLKTVNAGHVALETGGPDVAAVLRPAGGDEHFCVMMPIRHTQ